MDFINFDYTLLLRLVTALLFGGVIGLERGGKNHEAGLRTHMLLCLGSALVMVISVQMSEQFGVPQEVMRMSAQVLSGIGFLGAGSIIAHGNKIRGMTTATGLWTTACIGLAVGAGYYIIAGCTVLLMLFVMVILKPITRKLRKNSKNHKFEIEISEKETLNEIMETIERNGVDIVDFKFASEDDDNYVIEMEIEFIKKTSFNALVSILAKTEGIKSFKLVD